MDAKTELKPLNAIPRVARSLGIVLATPCLEPFSDNRRTGVFQGLLILDDRDVQLFEYVQAVVEFQGLADHALVRVLEDLPI